MLAAAVPLAAQQGLPLTAKLNDSWRWASFGPESGLPPGRVVEVLEGTEVPWVTTDEAVAWFDGHRWHRVAPPDAFPWPARRLVADREAVLGIARGSLVRVARTGVQQIPVTGRAAGDSLLSVAVLGDEDLLVLTAEGMVRLRDGLASVVSRPESMRRPRLLRTRPGNVWLIGDRVWRWTGAGWALWFDLPADQFRETEAGGLLTVGGEGGSRVYMWSPGGSPVPLPGSYGHITALSLAPDGAAILGLNSGQVVLREGGTWSSPSRVPRHLELVRQIVHRETGDFWTIGPRGLHLFRGSSSRWSHFRLPGRTEFDGFVNAILIRDDGTWWLGTGDGLVVGSPDQGWAETRIIHGVELGPVTAVAEDTAGQVWIGSGGGAEGAFRWDGRSWTRFGPGQGLAARIHAIESDSGGGLWLLGIPGTLEDGAAAWRWDGHSFERWDQRVGFPGGRVYAFDEGPKGTYWFGSDLGVSRWRQGEWRHWSIPREGYSNPGWAYRVLAAGDGGAWFGSRAMKDGLGRITASGALHWLSAPDAELNQARGEVTDLRRGGNGVIWFTTHGGVGRVVGEEVVGFLGPETGLELGRLWPVVPLGDRVVVGGAGIAVLDLSESGLLPPVVDLAPVRVTEEEVLVRWLPLAAWGHLPPETIDTRIRIDDGPWTGWSRSRELSLLRVAAGAHRIEVQARGLIGQEGPPAGVEFHVPGPWYRSWPFLLLLGATAAGFGALFLIHRRRIARHRRELASHQEVVERIADTVPAALLQFRLRDGMVLYGNATAPLLFELPLEQVISATMWDLAGPENRSRLLAVGERLATLPEGETVTEEVSIPRAGRRDQVVVLRFAVFDRGRSDGGGGRPEAALCVAQDVTDHRETQVQLAQSQKMETVGRLAGGVAHDFNNMLTAIRGYAELARAGLDAEHPVVPDLEEIQRAGDRAAGLTSKLLTFARRRVTTPAVLDLNRMVREVSGMVARLIGADVELRLLLSDDCWPVLADMAELEQVLVNLAVNARDAMPSGGRLTISTRNADHWNGSGAGGERLAGDVVLLSVQDTGHGVPDEVGSRVFEPFFTTKGPGRGTGLGLATCYGIVSQAGGVIRLDSRPGAGTTVTVALPRSRRQPVEGAGPSVRRGDGRGSGRILLVEDETQVRQLAARVLRTAGYQVSEAGSGHEALRLLEQEPAPDLLLTDVVMPGMGGHELWQAVKARGTWPELRVLYMSGYPEDPGLRSEAGRPEVGFLAKPFSPESLTREVREALRD